MKKILVTGSEGFIGSHLVNALVMQGHSVRAFCLYNSFNDTGWLKELSPEILKNVEIIFGDIRDYDSIIKSLNGVNRIFHLAALIAIPYSYNSPESYVDTNVKGTLNVLRAALKKEIEQVVHTSTSEVYGTAQFIPITESHPLVGQSPYAATKIGADQLAYSFYCSYGLPVSTVRPFNTFGPRQSLRAVIPTIMTQALNGVRQLNLGNVHSTRDFNFVQDTVNGMMAFLGNQQTLGKVINLGTGTEVTIKKVVEIIAEIIGSSLEINLDQQRIRPEKSEVERLCACNQEAKKILNWAPEYTLKQGLEITYRWFQQVMDRYNLTSENYII